QRQERLKAQALAEVRRQIQFAEQQRDALTGEQRRILDEAGQATRLSIDAYKAQSFIHYERHLARLAVDKDAEIHALRKEEDRRRGTLEDAMKQRKVVEQLSERVRLAFLEHVRKEEQKQFDEIASVRSALERRPARP
ncbi:MAG TPA: flagellar export protein FliJ, partial [Candidatus Hydrogenedentes bacterium]|nr:flagellar export protein FliJ [Candidatus Hydrogenedentota bacterium]